MRLSTRRRRGFINFVNTVLLLLFFGGIGLFFINRGFKTVPYGYVFLIMSGVIALIYIIRGREHFEYDSDGEVLNFRNYGVLPPPFWGWSRKNDEFPKYKLKEFGVVGSFIYKKVYIKIDSKKDRDVILRYDVSYLTAKEIRDLKISLTKVINKNKQCSISTN